MTKARIAYVFGCLLLFGAAFILGVLKSAMGGAKEIEKASAGGDATLNLGIVHQGAKAHANLQVPNRSGASVNIENVSTSCGCTVVREYASLIEPVNHVELPVTFTATGKPGPVEAQVHVFLSDGSTHSYALTAYVFSSTVGIVDFGQQLSSSSERRTFLLPWPGAEPFKLSRIEFPQQHLKVAAREVPQERLTEITVQLQPPLPYGALESEVLLHLEAPELPPTSLAVVGTILAPVEISTYYIPVGLLKRGSKKNLSGSVYSPSGEAISIEEVSVIAGPFSDVEVEDIAMDRKSVRFTVSAEEDPELRVCAGSIMIKARAGDFVRIFEVEASALLA